MTFGTASAQGRSVFETATMPNRAERGASILVTAPPLSKPGGVSQYLRVLLPHFQNKVHCFTAGARKDGDGWVASIIRLFRDWARFRRMLQSGLFDLVHLNPSLGLKALLRDG